MSVQILSSNKVRTFPLHKIPKQWSGKELPRHGSFLYFGHVDANTSGIINFTMDEIMKHCEANNLDILYTKGFLEFETNMVKLSKLDMTAALRVEPK